MYRLVRPLLFRLDAEQAHHLTLQLLRWAGDWALTRLVLRQLFALDAPQLAVDAFGLHFKNQVGLAAGYDKNGVAVPGLACLGFGHIEVGTVTRQAQVGNPRPRVHRIPAAQAIVNSMGFPNAGVNALHLPDQGDVPVGINIGKSKETLLEHAADDYCALYRQVYQQADYVAINVSSPNTLHLRQLQGRAAMTALLAAVTQVRNELQPRRPLLVKIAPDLTEAEIDDVVAAALTAGADGLIATNTTTSRERIPTAQRTLAGGVSGAPLRERATAVIRYAAQQAGDQLPIIGVGGILTAEDALAKLAAGARLVQLYSGLIYTGPGLVRQILAAELQAKK